MWTLILLFLVSVQINLFGIETSSKVSKVRKETFAIFAELGGQGIFVSLNGDYLFHPNFSLRGGLSFLIFGYGIPFSIYYLTNARTSHHFELGLGLTYTNVASFSFFGSGSSPKESLLLTGSIGYRYQPLKDGLFIRLCFTPLAIFEKNEYYDTNRNQTVTKNVIKLRPFAGISLGYSFSIK
ncbi:MAG: hypothetical protein N2517_07945 [Ignavibacteria bacterium]|nr:hypothetical protein [Ignavibacteria bacterium]